jgi:hypothetical protein
MSATSAKIKVSLRGVFLHIKNRHDLRGKIMMITWDSVLTERNSKKKKL